MNLEHFLDNEMKKDTMDVEIKFTNGDNHNDPNYEDYEVVDVKYVNRIAKITVRPFSKLITNQVPK